jgi:hypothetical protein
MATLSSIFSLVIENFRMSEQNNDILIHVFQITEVNFRKASTFTRNEGEK